MVVGGAGRRDHQAGEAGERPAGLRVVDRHDEVPVVGIDHQRVVAVRTQHDGPRDVRIGDAGPGEISGPDVDTGPGEISGPDWVSGPGGHDRRASGRRRCGRSRFRARGGGGRGLGSSRPGRGRVRAGGDLGGRCGRRHGRRRIGRLVGAGRGVGTRRGVGTGQNLGLFGRGGRGVGRGRIGLDHRRIGDRPIRFRAARPGSGDIPGHGEVTGPGGDLGPTGRPVDCRLVDRRAVRRRRLGAAGHRVEVDRVGFGAGGRVHGLPVPTGGLSGGEFGRQVVRRCRRRTQQQQRPARRKHAGAPQGESGDLPHGLGAGRRRRPTVPGPPPAAPLGPDGHHQQQHHADQERAHSRPRHVRWIRGADETDLGTTQVVGMPAPVDVKECSVPYCRVRIAVSTVNIPSHHAIVSPRARAPVLLRTRGDGNGCRPLHSASLGAAAGGLAFTLSETSGRRARRVGAPARSPHTWTPGTRREGSQGRAAHRRWRRLSRSGPSNGSQGRCRAGAAAPSRKVAPSRRGGAEQARRWRGSSRSRVQC